MDVLKVKVCVAKPNSEIISKGEVWKVNLKSRAEKGRANLEIVKLVSKELGRKVEIVKGFKSREKVLRVI